MSQNDVTVPVPPPSQSESRLIQSYLFITSPPDKIGGFAKDFYLLVLPAGFEPALDGF